MYKSLAVIEGHNINMLRLNTVDRPVMFCVNLTVRDSVQPQSNNFIAIALIYLLTVFFLFFFACTERHIDADLQAADIIACENSRPSSLPA